MGSHRHRPPRQDGSLAQVSTPPWRQGVFSVPLGIRPLLRLVALEVRPGDPGWGRGGEQAGDGDEEGDGMGTRTGRGMGTGVAGDKDMDWNRGEDRVDKVWDGNRMRTGMGMRSKMETGGQPGWGQGQGQR